MWLPKFEREGITFSVESHVGGYVFLFDGLECFAEYVVQYPSLGILVDVSHNFNDGCTIGEILRIISNLNITGLHLSDGISGEEVKKGTHLPVGHGEINFADFLEPFVKSKKIYGALEVISTSDNINDSLLKLKGYSGIEV